MRIVSHLCRVRPRDGSCRRFSHIDDIYITICQPARKAQRRQRHRAPQMGMRAARRLRHTQTGRALSTITSALTRQPKVLHRHTAGDCCHRKHIDADISSSYLSLLRSRHRSRMPCYHHHGEYDNIYACSSPCFSAPLGSKRSRNCLVFI